MSSILWYKDARRKEAKEKGDFSKLLPAISSRPPSSGRARRAPGRWRGGGPRASASCQERELRGGREARGRGPACRGQLIFTTVQSESPTSASPIRALYGPSTAALNARLPDSTGALEEGELTGPAELGQLSFQASDLRVLRRRRRPQAPHLLAARG